MKRGILISEIINIIILLGSCFLVIIECTKSVQSLQKYNWGLFKPQLIHAISQSQDNPLTISQAYFDNKKPQSTIRYIFSDRQSDIIIYNYNQNSGVNGFAVQEVFDPLLGNIRFEQNFLRISESDWIDTTKNIRINKQKEMKLSSSDAIEEKVQDFSHVEVGFIYTIALEEFSKNESPDIFPTLNLLKVNETMIAISSGDSQHLVIIQGKNLSESLSFKGLATQKRDNWEVLKHLKSINYHFDNSMENNSTIIFVKTSIRSNGGGEIQVRYSPEFINDYYIEDTDLVAVEQSRYELRFADKFNLTGNKTTIMDEALECATQSLSNLLGGIQYSYGDIQCVQEYEPNCQAYLPLYSTTPSRFGFPRPFLWDEGFHQMLTCQWDIEFCKQDIHKWFNTISPSGWIPREQPRGPELQSYISFLREDNREANPPSFLFNLLFLKRQGEIQFIETLLPKIESWFNWWMNIQKASNDFENIYESGKTQQQNENSTNSQQPLLFKWWGQDENSNFGSGMDDWPRVDDNFGDGLNYISKYNIDASVWAYFFSDSLFKLTNNSSYAITADNISKSISQLLFNNEDFIFYDLLKNTTFNNTSGMNETKVHLSSHLGYPNFMPLIVGMVDDTLILEKQIQALMNNETLWTTFGISSLSKQDPFFGKGNNYWRGPVWINIQYLLLRSMKLYYWDLSSLVDIFYHQLRDNVISTVCSQFHERGYFYEHFNQNQDGKGSGNHPFNGWTSLITLIITEQYI